MMAKLPSLANWEHSSHGLHTAAQLLGAIRQLVNSHQDNYLELAIRIERNGLSTDMLPGGGVVLLDFERAALVFTPQTGAAIDIPLTGQSQASLLEALLLTIDKHGQALVKPAQGQSYTQAFLAALAARDPAFEPKPGELVGEVPLAIDPSVCADYGRALYRIFTATARFRARLAGPQTPIVIWPEHFDLSTLWFPTNDRSEAAPVMNFGFAPFDGNTERPYLYAYAYPMPEGFEQLRLPTPARWHTEGWKGLFVAYDDLARADDPEALVESLFEAVYMLLAPTLTR
jgi:Family of unknown function (DUF5996)